MASKQVECPECGDIYKVQGMYGHLRMGHGLHGDKLEEKYSEAVGESRGAGMRERDVSKAQELFGPAGESGSLGKLRELAIARRMLDIVEDLNPRYSAVGRLQETCKERVAELEESLAEHILEDSDRDGDISDVLKPSPADRFLSS